MDLGKLLGDLIVAAQAALDAGMASVSITCAADGVDFTLTLYATGTQAGRPAGPATAKPTAKQQAQQQGQQPQHGR